MGSPSRSCGQDLPRHPGISLPVPRVGKPPGHSADHPPWARRRGRRSGSWSERCPPPRRRIPGTWAAAETGHDWGRGVVQAGPPGAAPRRCCVEHGRGSSEAGREGWGWRPPREESLREGLTAGRGSVPQKEVLTCAPPEGELRSHWQFQVSVGRGDPQGSWATTQRDLPYEGRRTTVCAHACVSVSVCACVCECTACITSVGE